MYKYLRPGFIQKILNKSLYPSLIISLILTLLGVILIIDSPLDYQQGIMVKVMYIHVPSAWLALIIYSIMAVLSAAYLVWRSPIVNLIARNCAPIGTIFALVTIITGSIWGKPIWGAWWVWDARLTSMLILLLFYFSYLALANNYNHPEQGSVNLAILALIGFINIPIVKFSVDFWNSLHQPASIIRSKGVAIHHSMLKPLIMMALASFSYFISLLLLRIKTAILVKKMIRIKLD